MKGMKQTTLALATAAMLASGAAQAALHDRGGGLLYDDVLNVTWLQDANYAKTSGYDADGRMAWDQAVTWANTLVYHDSVRNVDYSDWRLAANTPVGADWNYSSSLNGTTDIAFNITSPHSELSYMYYVNLGLKGRFSPTGALQSDFGVFGNGTTGGQKDVGLVKNYQSYFYWYGTAAYAPRETGYAWNFWTREGFQVPYNWDGGSVYYAWAVRPGDVAAPIPEPETHAMLLAGLGLLGAMAKRRRRSSDAS